jgi:cytochrome P450
MSQDLQTHPTDLVTASPPPTVRGHLLFGNYQRFYRDPLRVVTETSREWGDIVELRLLPGISTHLVTHPDGVEQVLKRNQKNYRKSDIFVRPVSLLAGRGLLTNEGESWLRQRRLAQPAFHRKRLTALVALMANSAELTALNWTERQSQEPVIDVLGEMTRLTLGIASRALFSIDYSDDADRVGSAVRVAFEHINYRMNTPFALPLKILTLRNRHFLHARQTLDNLVYDLIRERKRTGEHPGDLLSMLMDARDEETGEGMSDRQLRDEVLTLLIAGDETTSAALAWTWYLLALHPSAETRLHAELAGVLGGRTPDAADLPALPYTRMAFEEALRLYPPAWGQPRQAINEDQIDGYRIPAGALVTISQWVTHRHPDFWENPETFDPERFSPQRSVARPTFAYFPFGEGARLYRRELRADGGTDYSRYPRPTLSAGAGTRLSGQARPNLRAASVGWTAHAGAHARPGEHLRDLIRLNRCPDQGPLASPARSARRRGPLRPRNQPRSIHPACAGSGDRPDHR